MWEAFKVNIIVHLPTEEVKVKELKKAVADIHSEKIINTFQKFNLQKVELERIVNSVIENK